MAGDFVVASVPAPVSVANKGQRENTQPTTIMKITKVAVLIWLSASMPSFGAVEAVLFHVTTNETFTVPAGKVLIIENFMRSGTSFNVTHRIEKGTNSFILSFDESREFGVKLPVKIPEGWTFRGFGNDNEETDVLIFGLLVSPSDLFASAQHRIDQIAVNGGIASLDIQMASPRPARINVEKSPEADNGWHAAENAVVAATTNKTRYVATVPVDGDKGFIRTKARPREQ